MYTKRGFTLIELLVVIAIIGILSVIVVTQVGSSRVKARNSTAKSDITEMSKAIEVYKNNNDENILLSSFQGTASIGDGIAGPTGLGSTSGIFKEMFNGGGVISGSINGYSIKVDKTPSTAHSYWYLTSERRDDGNEVVKRSTTAGYRVHSVLVPVAGNDRTRFWVMNGASGEGVSSDVPPVAAPVN